MAGFFERLKSGLSRTAEAVARMYQGREFEEVKLDGMRKIIAGPGYAKLNVAYRRSAADSKYFGSVAKTGPAAEADPEILSRELLTLAAAPTPADVESALRAVVERASKAPVPVAVLGLAPVAALENWSPQVRSDVLTLLGENAGLGPLPSRQGYEPLVQRFFREVNTSGNFSELESCVPGLWQADGAALADDPDRYVPMVHHARSDRPSGR